MGKTITIIGGGEIKDYAAVSQEIAGSTIFCADSGYHHCQKLQVIPSLLIGDFDSIGTIPKDIPQIPLSVHKNYTDSAHAVQEALKRQPNNLILTGMLGGRLDHALANLALLVDCATKGYAVLLTDGVTTVHPLVAKEGIGLQSFPFEPLDHHYFSLLAHSDICQQVSICGGKYPLNDYHLTNQEARAVSNEFIEQEVRVEFSSGIILFITTPKE